MAKAAAKAQKRVIKDPADHKKPSLRISQIVFGRESDGQKVRYLLDRTGLGTRREIPENIVLVRWRQRVWKGYRFSGGRLGPNVWNGLAVALGPKPKKDWMSLTVEQIQDRLVASRPKMGVFKSSVPAASVIHGLIQVCGWQRLEKIMARHLDPDRGKARGTPDLFLFAIDETGRSTMGRFVEVKKPEEPASDDQKAEVDFLNALGLHARIVRLIER
jgi:hypothetical protein